MRLLHWRGRQMWFNVFLITSAVLFWCLNLRSDGAMHPAVYGDGVVSVDASAWAAGLLGAALLPLIGILLDGRGWIFPALRLIGAITQVAMFTWLAKSSLSAPYGAVVAAFSGGFFLPVCLAFLWLNIKDAIWRWRDYRHGVAVR